MNRACGLAVAVAVIADDRVSIWPGWSVPLAAVILAACLALLAGGMSALAAVIVSRTWPRPVRAGVRTTARTGVRPVRADIPVLRLTLDRESSGGDAE